MPRKKARPANKPTRPPLRQRVKDAYRDAILDAAEVVFGRGDYENVRVSDLAKEAGVSVGTLYNYFDDKESIFAALAERGRGQFEAALAPALTEKDPSTRLDAIVRVTLQFLEERGALFAIHVARGGSQTAVARGDASERESRAGFQRLLVTAIEQAAAARQLRDDVPAESLAVALGGLVQGFIDAWLAADRKVRLAASADLILKLFRQGALAHRRG